jgi:DNA-binding IclR family transcriptional regulator
MEGTTAAPTTVGLPSCVAFCRPVRERFIKLLTLKAIACTLYLLSALEFRIVKQDTNGGSQTVDRALAVLNALVDANGPVTLDRITALTGLHRSIVYRLLRSLESAGYVVRGGEVGGYGIGPTLLAMSVSVARRFDIGSFVRPAMDQIVEEFGETVSLHIHSADRRICVEVAEGTHAIRRMIPIGESHAVYIGETGRALLSSMPDTEVSSQLEQAAAAGHDPDQIRNGVEYTRLKGFFIGIGTRTADVGAISIPMTGLDGSLYALTVSGPAGRWGEAAMQAAVPRIMELLRPVQGKLAQGARNNPRNK